MPEKKKKKKKKIQNRGLGRNEERNIKWMEEAKTFLCVCVYGIQEIKWWTVWIGVSRLLLRNLLDISNTLDANVSANHLNPISTIFGLIN
uniref:Uncharacterized protein n=1 Tax=Bracon brevicornis TaxID=1563983 RepID=A0A6V7IL59_9HYME